MRLLLGILFTTTYGIILRLSQDWFGGILSLMSTSFVILSPVIIGMVTIFFIPYQKIKKPITAFFIPWLTCLAILAITLFFSVEGMICWVMVFPLFATGSGIGGLIARVIKKRRYEKNNDVLLDDKINNSLNISLAMLLPFFAGYIEGDKMMYSEDVEVKQMIILNKSSEEVWQKISFLNEDKISEKNSETILSTIMRFPKHLSTEQKDLSVGGTRIAYYSDGLEFRETLKEIIPYKKLVLSSSTIKNRKEKKKDVQMLLGSKFFKITEDTYELEKISSNKTKLSLTSKAIVNTPFNWYSKIWVNIFLSDILSGELDKVQNRLEQ